MSIAEFLRTHSLGQLDQMLKQGQVVLTRKGRRLMVEPPKVGAPPLSPAPRFQRPHPFQRPPKSLADFE